MEDRAQLLRHCRPSLVTTMHASSACDVGCDSPSTISHAALGPRTKPSCTSVSHASAHHHPCSGNAWKRWAEPSSMHPALRLRRSGQCTFSISQPADVNNPPPISKHCATDRYYPPRLADAIRAAKLLDQGTGFWRRASQAPRQITLRYHHLALSVVSKRACLLQSGCGRVACDGFTSRSGRREEAARRREA
jgi:hypothetical protein